MTVSKYVDDLRTGWGRTKRVHWEPTPDIARMKVRVGAYCLWLPQSMVE